MRESRCAREISIAVLFPFLLRDPLIGTRLQHVQRERAAIQHLIVELAQIELWPQLFLGALPQLAEFQLTEFVAESLGGPGDVAVRFGLDRRLVDSSGLAHEFYDLVSSPSLGVDPGIDHQAYRAKQ